MAVARKTVALFAPEGQGHINPLVALAKAMVQKGLEVHFFAPSSAREKVEGAGAIWCHMGSEDWELFAAARQVVERRLPQEVGPEVAAAMPAAVLPATLDVMPFLIWRMAQIRPALLVHDAAVPWAAVLGRVLRIPAVCSMTALPAPLSGPSTGGHRWSPATTANLSASADALRVAYDVEMDIGQTYTNYQPFTIIWSSRAWHKGHIEFSASQFRYWGPLVSDRVGTQAPPAVPGSGPLVFISLGTVVTGNLFRKFETVIKDFYAKAVAAAAALPEVRFLMVTGKKVPAQEGGRSLLGKLVPPNMVLAEHVDQIAVLQASAAFVTHCGQNSASEAIMNAVPVVPVPLVGDQLENADRFEELGCGVVQSYFRDVATGQNVSDASVDRVTAESLTEAIRRVLEVPSYREAIAALGCRQEAECGGQSTGDRIDAMLAYAEVQGQSGLLA